MREAFEIAADSGSTWRVEALIGRGRTAVVYAVRGPRNEAGAAKLLSPRRLEVTDTMRERFERERRRLAEISHPHVLRVLDAGTSRGDPVLICERMAGSLHDRIEPGLPLDRCVAWLAQAAAGLAELHARGMVHRDFSPKNLLLKDDGQLVVGDFGTVMHLDDVAVAATGKPDSLFYISPQRFEDARADDLHSLGQTAWHLLIGCPPRGDARSVRELRDDVPGVLSDFVDALRAYGAERQPTAEDALAALVELATPLPSTSSSPPPGSPRARPSGRARPPARPGARAA